MIKNNNTPSLSSSFRYSKVLEKGKPVHNPGDDFYIKHPPMNLSRRAKIFSPFDALKGYDEAIAATIAEHNAMYEDSNSDDTDDEFIGYMDDNP